MFQEERATTVQVHPALVEELKERQRIVFEETGKKSLGGITNFSRLAAFELRLMRQSGEQIFNEMKLKHSKINTKHIDDEEYVPYELYKNLYIFASALSKKKDQKQIKVEIAKIKGIQKNEVNIFW